MNFNIVKRFHSKLKNKVGIDIGSSSVKMIEVASSGENLNLVCLGTKRVSSAAREPLVEAIKSLSNEIKITARDAAISVSGPSVMVRFVPMPKMRDDELKSAIRFEAEKYIPFAINDCIVDHQILRRNEKDGKFEILLVAVKKDFVMSRISIAEDCGYSVNAVDVDTFALANAFLKNLPQTSVGKTVALLNIGFNFTNVAIIRDQALCFSRDIAVGGDDFNQAISKSFGVDALSAEDIKLSPGERLSDMIVCTKCIANNLLEETRLSLSYYENQCGRGVDEICISGGSSGISGLEALFQDAFESKPVFWDPLGFLDKSNSSLDMALIKKTKSSFAVAAGLALR